VPVVNGVGLGLRWCFLEEVLESVRGRAAPLAVDFFEVCPENYMRRGGYIPSALAEIREHTPVLSHGLTLSIGGLEPQDDAYLAELTRFVRGLGAPFHSDHLCFSTAGGRFTHDLLPLPFIGEAITHVAARAREVRERLGVPLALENISYYVRPGAAELSEAAFLRAVLEEADVGLLLDVNNIFVNAKNFGFDPVTFLEALPLERVVQIHVAGHCYVERYERIIDNHGAETRDEVLDLLELAVSRVGPVPVLLERDSNVPPLSELLVELSRVRSAYQRGLARRAA
jgi:uncharacterized protein (UPF0276 family)